MLLPFLLLFFSSLSPIYPFLSSSLLDLPLASFLCHTFSSWYNEPAVLGTESLEPQGFKKCPLKTSKTLKFLLCCAHLLKCGQKASRGEVFTRNLVTNFFLNLKGSSLFLMDLRRGLLSIFWEIVKGLLGEQAPNPGWHKAKTLTTSGSYALDQNVKSARCLYRVLFLSLVGLNWTRFPKSSSPLHLPEPLTR